MIKYIIIVFAILAAAATWLVIDMRQNLTWSSLDLNNRSPANERRDGLAQYILNLPFSDRFKEYYKALGVSDDGAGQHSSNRGLNKYNQELAKENPCFAQLVKLFVDEIKEIDAKRKISDPEKSDRKASLSDSLGPDTKPKSGFLWALALKFADNDPNLAMSLIGFCGHDDMMIGIKNVNTEKEKLYAQLGFAIKPRHESACPGPLSVMHWPKALGDDVDIPQALKDQVIRTQAPTGGASTLNAKAYHMTAGAYVTCLLYQQAIPAYFVREVHTIATNAYRSKTICSYIFEDVKRGKISDNVGPISDEEIDAANEFYQSTKCASTENLDPKRKLLCSILENKTKEKVRGYLSRADAGALLSKMPYFNDHIDTPCDTIYLESFLEKNIDGLRSRHCPKKWSKERCDKALDVLKSWSMDFKWTRAQHLVGEEFARKNCKSIRPQSSLHNACNALQKVQSATRSKGPSVPRSAVQ